MKIIKIYLNYGCKVELSAASDKPNVATDELARRCVGDDVRTLWKAARDEIPAGHLF
ncbi:MAG: hypothetical protein JW873_00635 [Candidatus Saganbacteria bacterium]|nr:hypothetical protein [Candidatus Saganbacteria bacterium]